MKTINKLLAFTLAVTPFALTASETTTPRPSTYTVRPELCFDSQTTAYGKIKSLHAGRSFDYEYKRADNFFYGLSSTALLGNVSVKFKHQGYSYAQNFKPLTLSVEGRTGYTLNGPHNSEFSPYVGWGTIFILPDADRLGVNHTDFYVTMGFKSMYKYSDSLKFGLNASVAHALGYAQRTHEYSTSAWVGAGDAWGYEFGLPIHYFPEKLKGFGSEVEPKIRSFGNKFATARPGISFNCVYKY